MNLVLRPTALDDLLQLTQYYLTVRPDTALKFYNRLRETFDLIRVHP